MANLDPEKTFSEEKQKEKVKKYMTASKEIEKEKEVEKAVVEEERNWYKDKQKWGIFWLLLEKECNEVVSATFYPGKNPNTGDTVLIKLKVVKEELYIAKKEIGIYKPVMSPE